MRYRALSDDGDYTFGRGQGNFLVDSSAAVAQAVRTRLALATGEWFLDSSEGTPYSTQVLGVRTAATYDPALRGRILGTPGVRALLSYESTRDPDIRKLTVRALADTIYGQTMVTQTL